ncbi:hypothetical protein CEXT_486021 [Caerostris extrusa]|uniref:Uncharacterized protein n=1 Tax=Caerostris extrusa TaxID=172846 RepID=A0AAV4XY40_CAEEX|nr:hypothetical protein CEXT_486021 [Caerostris extrusa]
MLPCLQIGYSPPIPKSELSKSRSHTGSLRVPRRSSCLAPVKGDHSALKECNRRPPTPLTVFPDSSLCPRFSYPNHPDGFLYGRTHSGSTRSRSRTVPELELRRYSPLASDGYSKHERTYKENLGPLQNRRLDSLSTSNRSVHKSVSDISISGKVTPSPHTLHYKHHMHHRVSMDTTDDVISHTNSTDSGLGSLRSSTQCTCHGRQSPGSVHSSSQSPSLSTCRCCNCPHQVSPKSQESSPKLFKSSSCSTLPSVLSHQSRPQLTQFPPRTSLRKMVSHQGEERSKMIPLQKTSSCSSLLDRTSNTFQVANVPVYNDNMVKVYARIASVIPEDFKTATSSQGGRRKDSSLTYDSIPSTTEHPVCLTTTFKSTSPLAPKGLDLVNDNTTDKNTPSTEIYSQIKDCSLSEPYERKPVLERTSLNQRPKSMGVVVPSSGPNPVYLKSALKKPTQSAILQVKDLAQPESEVVSKPSEVEYAVVDKSKKNRFASLPILNGSAPTLPETEDKDPLYPLRKCCTKATSPCTGAGPPPPRRACWSACRP